MMKKTCYPMFVFLIFALCLEGCRSSIEQHGSVIDIDLTQIYPEQEYVLEDIAEVSYIPLETRDDFLVAGTLSYMDSEHIVIKSSRRDQLFFFDRNTGAALSVLNRQGRSGNEYNQIDAFFCDRDAEEVFVLDVSKRFVLVYDFNQTFKRSFEVPEDCVNMAAYDDSSLLVYIEQDTISKPFLMISKEDGQILHILDVIVGPRLNAMRLQIGDFVSETRMRGGSVSFVTIDDGLLISDWACDTLYSLDYRGVLKPVAIRKPLAHEMKPCLRLHIKGDSGRFVFFLSSLLPDVIGRGGPSIENRRYAYDRQEHKIVTPRFVLADDPSGTVWHGEHWGNQFGAYMVCELKTEDLYAAYREKKLNGRLSEIAATLKEDDNPVLMVVSNSEQK